MNQKVKGIILVGIGASSYGMVATFVKLGMLNGYSIAELTFAQAVVGLAAFIVLALGMMLVKKNIFPKKPKRKDIIQLLLGGIPLGGTSIFYYLSVNYGIPVSVCIVLLMQSVWMGAVLDFFVNKIVPGPQKIVAIIIVLVGTVFATNVLGNTVALDWRGVVCGLLAAVTYCLNMFVSNKVAAEYHPIQRSLLLMTGSVILVSMVWGPSIIGDFNPSVLWTWGLAIAFFGTILPPLLFTSGMPLINVGLGSILAALELPVSVTMAYVLLHETVVAGQWFGVGLIILAIILLNIKFPKKVKTA